MANITQKDIDNANSSNIWFGAKEGDLLYETPENLAKTRENLSFIKTGTTDDRKSVNVSYETLYGLENLDYTSKRRKIVMDAFKNSESYKILDENTQNKIEALFLLDLKDANQEDYKNIDKEVLEKLADLDKIHRNNVTKIQSQYNKINLSNAEETENTQTNEEIPVASEDPENFTTSTEKWDESYVINGVGGNTFSSEADALNSIQNKISSGNYGTTPSSEGDCRVSLNIVPLSNMTNVFLEQSEFNKRMSYILGSQSGFLYNLYKNTAGLVFPYTPSISMDSSVEYESIHINHSNLAVQNYKSTPPPSLSISAEFTADTPENAVYMIGAIWFFRALSKCDFGENAQNPGMPPPILYLNGWGNLINNIPVVITRFNTNLEKDKHYVKVNVGTDQWVPTKLTMQIGLAIQPNIDTYKKQFSLEKYKNGILGGTYELFSGENIDRNNFFVEKTTNFKIDTTGYVQHESKDTDIYSSETNVEVGSVYKDKRGSGAGWTW